MITNAKFIHPDALADGFTEDDIEEGTPATIFIRKDPLGLELENGLRVHASDFLDRVRADAIEHVAYAPATVKKVDRDKNGRVWSVIAYDETHPLRFDHQFVRRRFASRARGKNPIMPTTVWARFIADLRDRLVTGCNDPDVYKRFYVQTLVVGRRVQPHEHAEALRDQRKRIWSVIMETKASSAHAVIPASSLTQAS